MNIVIGAEFEKYIADQIETGRFSDASDVVQSALKLQEAQFEAYDRLRHEISRGIADIEAGRHGYVAASDIIARSKSKAALR